MQFKQIITINNAPLYGGIIIVIIIIISIIYASTVEKRVKRVPSGSQTGTADESEKDMHGKGNWPIAHTLFVPFLSSFQ